MGVGAGLYVYDVVVKSSRSLSHPMSSCVFLLHLSDLTFKFITDISFFVTLNSTSRLIGAKIQQQNS